MNFIAAPTKALDHNVCFYFGAAFGPLFFCRCRPQRLRFRPNWRVSPKEEKRRKALWTPSGLENGVLCLSSRQGNQTLLPDDRLVFNSRQFFWSKVVSPVGKAEKAMAVVRNYANSGWRFQVEPNTSCSLFSASVIEIGNPLFYQPPGFIDRYYLGKSQDSMVAFAR